MRLFSNKFDRSLIILAVLSVGMLFACFLESMPTTFAENEETEIVANSEWHFVTIFDKGERLTIRTKALTVKDTLDRLKITVDEADTIEPGLDSEIDMDNFFVNIYRARPVMVLDGAVNKYIMTSKHEVRDIAKAAGITIYDGDEVTAVMNSQFLEAGVAEVYQVVRNGGRTLTVEEDIPFSQQTVKDYTIGAGNSKVLQLGEIGKKTSVYRIEYIDGQEVLRELVSSTVTREAVPRIVAVGANPIEMKPLTKSMGRNRYTINGIERQETYYDLNMGRVMQNAKNWSGCSHTGHYSVRADGVKVDDDGYVLVAANLNYYPRCSVVQTSLGQGKVYDTGSFATANPQQFDIATDWTHRNGV